MGVKEKHIEKDSIGTVEGPQIIVYNDDVNTFDHVISCFVEFCGHTPEQAEQCALLIHHNGKSEVMHGDIMELIPPHSALVINGLRAKIE